MESLAGARRRCKWCAETQLDRLPGCCSVAWSVFFARSNEAAFRRKTKSSRTDGLLISCATVFASDFPQNLLRFCTGRASGTPVIIVSQQAALPVGCHHELNVDHGERGAGTAQISFPATHAASK